MTFIKKSISEFKALTAEEQQIYLEQKESHDSAQTISMLNSIEDMKKVNDDLLLKIKSSEEVQIKQGTELSKLKEQKSKTLSTKSLLVGVLEAKKKELEELVKSGKGSVSIVLDRKATQTYGDIDSGEDFAQFRAGIIDQPVRKPVFRNLFFQTPLGTQYMKYTEQDSVVRDAQNVANCAAVTSTTKETLKVSTIEPKKIKDQIDACIDFLNDFALMEARIKRLLSQSVSLKVDQQILLGTGAGLETNSISSVSSEFDDANAACVLTTSIQAPNLVDLISGMVTQIYELGQQNDFIPDVAVVNNCDWFKDVASLKDANNNYLDTRITRQGGETFIVTLSGLVKVVTSPIVPQNNCYVFDSTKGEIIDRQRFTIDISFENATNWEEDLVSMKGAERLEFLVPNEWANAFMKCSDVGAAIIAITKV